MSNRFFVSAVILMTLISVGTFTRAWSLSEEPGEMSQDDSFNEPRGVERRLEIMNEGLGLSDEQIASVRDVFAAEFEKSRLLRKGLKALRDEMIETVKVIPFDEGAVRKIATRQAESKIELTVLKARTHNGILTILTPEQRTLFEEMSPLGKGRHDSKKNRGRNEEGGRFPGGKGRQ